MSHAHRDLADLIPWYVNDSIGEQDRQKLTEHLSLCAQCRDEVAQELQILRGMTSDAAIEYMPTASLRRLQSRLDAIGGGSAISRQPTPIAAPAPSAIAAHIQTPTLGTNRPLRLPRRPRAMQWPAVMTGSVAALAMACGLFVADRWFQLRGSATRSDYHTVTTAMPRAEDEVIRAVFAPSVTLARLQRILDESGLRIVSGPTEAGVYSLAMQSRPTPSSVAVSGSLALLRAHSEVRFAEDTQSPAGSAHSP